ncbi:MAG: hypothetical protein INH41_04025 [Myxococcaceae bacterium]|jgi:hypothetical protein|nr:hypothetical protein [Myxococcaceae bacterium]MCA3011549.1 hypothetical protein [Myxococcaceae bacterium]
MRAAVPGLLACVLLGACGDQRPCTACPALTGPYLISWQRGVPADGCPARGPVPVNLTLSQQGNRLSTLVDGLELRGTLFDTYDFSLNGGLDDLGYTLRGRAVVDGPLALPDGGAPQPARVRLVGSLNSRKGACDLSEPFTADRL